MVHDKRLAVQGSAEVSGKIRDGLIGVYDGKSKKGYAPYNPKKANQDAMVMTEDAATQSLLLCVMDGHGEFGDKVSQDLKASWPGMLFKHPKFADDATVPEALSETILQAEAKMLKKMQGNADFSGTTFVACVIRGTTLWSANVGDSRITCGERKPDGSGYVARNITDDHKPDSPGEKERILAKGGRVFAVQYDDGIDGPQRVWLGNMDIPGLAMARSLGDTIAHSAGVISEPEIRVETIDPEKMAFLVVASDGLWEFMTDQDVVDQVAAGQGKAPQQLVGELVETANQLWLKEEEVRALSHFFQYFSSLSLSFSLSLSLYICIRRSSALFFFLCTSFLIVALFVLSAR